MDRKWELKKAPKLVSDLLDDVVALLAIKEKDFSDEMKQDQDEFTQNLDDIFSIVATLDNFTKLEECKFVVKKVRDLNERIMGGLERATVFNEHERLFDTPETD